MQDKEGRKKKSTDLLKESNLTYEDYASIDDDNRYELVDGKLELMSPAPSVTHQMISFEMQKVITHNCESDYIILYAPVDVILSPHEVRQPDLVLVHRSRTEIIKKHGIEGVPDLVVEIISPSTMKRDKMDKVHTYAKYRIPEYWIVEPETGALEQHVLRNRNYDLVDIFIDNAHISSKNISCVSFTMAEIMNKIPELSCD